MASISTPGSGGSGKRPVDAEIPLVPFIDLLLCCVMFLLVTAVWNQLSQLEARAPESAGPAAAVASTDLSPSLSLTAEGWRVSSGAGDRVEGTLDDEAALTSALAFAHRAGGTRLVVGADDGVGYARVIGALDLAMAAGFSDVSMAGAETW